MAVERQTQEVIESSWTAAGWPEVDPAAVALTYAKWPLDTLYVEFFGAPRPGYYVSIEPDDRPTEGLMVKVSEDDATVVGLMVHAYLAWAESRRPFWLDLAPLAGIPDQTLDAFGLPPRSTPIDRDTAIAAFLADVRSAWDEAVQAELPGVPADG